MNMNATVIWSHGKDAAPWGNKSRRLMDVARSLGYGFEAVDYQDLNNAPDQRVKRLLTVCMELDHPVVLAGSSMGGYVSAVAGMEAETLGVFALAPAFYMPGYEWQEFPGLPERVEVVHGWRDEVVPVEHSLRFARVHRPTLHLVDDDHRLARSVERVAQWFGAFLDSLRRDEADRLP